MISHIQKYLKSKKYKIIMYKAGKKRIIKIFVSISTASMIPRIAEHNCNRAKVGDFIVLGISKGDHGPLDPQNILGKVLKIENGVY